MRQAALLFCLALLAFLFSCGGLTYVPVKTPADFEEERREVVTEQLRSDFSQQKMRYVPVAFGVQTVVKPQSHYKLDSLYGLKYELEKQGLTNQKLEDEIKVEQLIVSTDTTAAYYLEKHVFSLEDSLKYEAVFAYLYVDAANKISRVEIKEITNVQRKDVGMYACYVLDESFLYPHAFPDPAEAEFYALYKTKLQSLEEEEKTNFLNHMLSVMRVANRYESLDKSFLISEFTRQYVQGNSRNMLDERFVEMKEFFDDKNELLYYYIDYECSTSDVNNELVLKRYEVYLDPYLQLIELKNKP